MEQEQKPFNPYDHMDREELYGVIRDLQMARREIDHHYSLVQAVLTRMHAERIVG